MHLTILKVKIKHNILLISAALLLYKPSIQNTVIEPVGSPPTALSLNFSELTELGGTALSGIDTASESKPVRGTETFNAL